MGRAFLAYAHPMIHDVRIARVAFVEVMGVSPAVEAKRPAYRESLVGVIEAEARPAVDAGEITGRDFRFTPGHRPATTSGSHHVQT